MQALGLDSFTVIYYTSVALA